MSIEQKAADPLAGVEFVEVDGVEYPLTEQDIERIREKVRPDVEQHRKEAIFALVEKALEEERVRREAVESALEADIRRELTDPPAEAVEKAVRAALFERFPDYDTALEGYVSIVNAPE